MECFLSDNKATTLIKLKKAFEDTKETEQYDKNCQILRIDYDEYSLVINNFFRTILISNEISKRVFHLTTLVIIDSATNYMAWYIRRKCLDKRTELEINLEDEQDWLDSITISNQKNYQIWHHRRFISELTKCYQKEFSIINQILVEEPKNYHAWCHKIWVVRRFNLYVQELEFSRKMLNRDLRNNSAWNYRFFLVSSCHLIANKYYKNTEDSKNMKVNSALDDVDKSILGIISQITLLKEVEFSIKYLIMDVDNESVYSYIRGLYDNPDINNYNNIKDENNNNDNNSNNNNNENNNTSTSKEKLRLFENALLKNSSEEIINKSNSCYQILSLKLDMLIENKEVLSVEYFNKTKDNNESNENNELYNSILKLENEIITLYDILKKLDYIREKYWAWRKQNFMNNLVKK